MHGLIKATCSDTSLHAKVAEFPYRGGQDFHTEVGKISIQRWGGFPYRGGQRRAKLPSRGGQNFHAKVAKNFRTEVGRIPFRGGQEFYAEVGKISK